VPREAEQREQIFPEALIVAPGPALDLPDAVLKKVYYKNALRLFPTLSKTGFPN